MRFCAPSASAMRQDQKTRLKPNDSRLYGACKPRRFHIVLLYKSRLELNGSRCSADTPFCTMGTPPQLRAVLNDAGGRSFVTSSPHARASVLVALPSPSHLAFASGSNST